VTDKRHVNKDVMVYNQYKHYAQVFANYF